MAQAGRPKYRILIVDDDERHIQDIRLLISETAAASPGSMGIDADELELSGLARPSEIDAFVVWERGLNEPST